MSAIRHRYTGDRANAQSTDVEPTKQTVAVFLREGLPAIQSTIRPGSWTSYRSNMERHVMPRIGSHQLRSVNAMQLNAMYTELLTSGRCDGKEGSRRAP